MISRRTFAKQTGTAITALLLPTTIFPMNNEKSYKMGLQAFTIRDTMENDLIGSLKTVQSLGYEDLELYGFNPDSVSYYGHSAKDFKLLLDDLGLSSSSCHYGFSDYMNSGEAELDKYIDACIKGATALNHSYITWPWMAPEFRNLETFKKLPELLNKIGEKVTAAGLGFAYHNHDFEFVDYNGQTGYDIIMSQTDPELVKLQLDLYWAVHSSKLSPADLIAKQPERFVMWHIKDMDKVTRNYSELGNGSIDYATMLPKLDKSGLEYYYLEQGGNFAVNSIQSITDSANYFKAYLQKYL
ncbi:sugar phosphate isomerase/epimerase family protein [Maribacter aestuarii]|uniref:sugar phosphate isomerase/epimerase family protein n=1 Tax=Maribacter aestuarii TaxID=1130723 RepID=UPI00248BC13C|nr:sugar phosphate isomerase/epimerase [Maribacter aestuarii]